MAEAMVFLGHEQTTQLLHNKFVVVIGDSIQRSVYKDIVLLLQKDKHLSDNQLRKKGELTFESDTLVVGGCHDTLNNGTGYREVRQFRTQHHLVRFYFATRVFSAYMESVLEDFRCGPTPDMVIVNSCVWDISRYEATWKKDYKENLHLFFGRLKEVVSEETLVVWNLTMPLGHKIRGGFLTPEIEYRAASLRYDVVEANLSGGTLADAHGWDVLDMHYNFRFLLQQRAADGVHWNALAHRRMTTLLLRHAAAAWGVRLPSPTVPPLAAAATTPLGTTAAHMPPPASCQPLPSRKALCEVNWKNPATSSDVRKRVTQPLKEAWPAGNKQPHDRQNANRRAKLAAEVAGNFQPNRPDHHQYPSHQYVTRNRHTRKAYAGPYNHPRSTKRPQQIYFD